MNNSTKIPFNFGLFKILILLPGLLLLIYSVFLILGSSVKISLIDIQKFNDIPAIRTYQYLRNISLMIYLVFFPLAGAYTLIALFVNNLTHKFKTISLLLLFFMLALILTLFDLYIAGLILIH